MMYYKKQLRTFLENFLTTTTFKKKGFIKITNDNIYFVSTIANFDIEKYDDNQYDLVIGNNKLHIRVCIDPNTCTYYNTKDTQKNTYITFVIKETLEIKINIYK